MSWTHERARIASLTRSRAVDDPELVDARRNLAAEKLAEHVRRVVDAAPPLTPEQRDRIAALLRPVATPEDRAAAGRSASASPHDVGRNAPGRPGSQRQPVNATPGRRGGVIPAAGRGAA